MCYCTVPDLILCLMAFILPPVAVLIRSGPYSPDLLLNIVLTLLGGLPGIVHAIYYIMITSPIRADPDSSQYDQPWEGQRYRRPITLVTEQPQANTSLLASSQNVSYHGSSQYHAAADGATQDTKQYQGPPPPYVELV
ncbi:Sna4p Ecym_8031 [Eremothecium cymbalariae DBVPG|uniref:Stress response RCI peptide n=1 Tax=Eremothecium cymbalariae (strain CBS 270.75 / DBVPG 7215 / KCTC 17166 / NRRL Y-17582) TaxID=931890 RepID=G8JWV3_ERECY|nr:Hypothetical protein Ecym_8031 [Eremothecium cymbalariae DBVPG\